MSKIDDINLDGLLFDSVSERYNSGESISIIAESIGVERHYLSRFMKKNGFTYKTKTLSSWAKENGIVDVEEWIKIKYLNENKSTNDLSRMIGISNVAILNWMEKFNIPVRGYSESKKLSLSTMTKEDLAKYIENIETKKKKTVSEWSDDKKSAYGKSISEAGKKFWANVSDEYMQQKREMGKRIAEKRLNSWSDKQKSDCLERLQNGKNKRLSRMTQEERKESMKKVYAAHRLKYDTDPEYRKMCSRNTVLGQNGRESKPEKALKESLRDLGYFGFSEQFAFDRFSIDLVFEDVKLAIEVDGEYWHSLEKNKERDAIKNRMLADCGWNLMRFPASKVYKDPTGYAWNIIQAYETLRISD
jgi:very-short-patch-repair endonuclease